MLIYVPTLKEESPLGSTVLVSPQSFRINGNEAARNQKCHLSPWCSVAKPLSSKSLGSAPSALTSAKGQKCFPRMTDTGKELPLSSYRSHLTVMRLQVTEITALPYESVIITGEDVRFTAGRRDTRLGSTIKTEGIR